MLATVRALMAKAADPAVTHAEADAYADKAAALMAKYGIEAAMLHAAQPDTDRPGDLLITPPGPYSKEKAQLVALLADAMACKALIRRAQGALWSAHLFGYTSDLYRVDLVAGSLLTQLTLRAATTPIPEEANPRAYRRGYILGWRTTVLARITRAEQHARAQATSQP